MTIALLPKGRRNRERYLSNRILPLNYMEDFSIMGFIVDRLPEASAILASRGYKVLESQHGNDLIITRSEQISEIDYLLRLADIQVLYTDIADTIYQA